MPETLDTGLKSCKIVGMIPLFKSSFSVGKSILTLAEPEKQKKDGPDSIIQIALENNLKTLHLVEDSLTGFLTAFKTCAKHDIHLRFGVRMDICNSYESADSSKSKLILFAKNDAGFKSISKIFTFANTEKDGIISNDDLAARVSDDVLIAVPFYDSFVWQNWQFFRNCMPTFLKDFDHVFFTEDNKLPFDSVIGESVKSLTPTPIMVKSIYYKNREDYEAWLTYKIACNRRMGKHQTLSAPEINGCASKEFCFQSWKEMS